MSISMALLSPPHLPSISFSTSSSTSLKPNLTFKPSLSLTPRRPFFLLSTPKASSENGAGTPTSSTATAVVDSEPEAVLEVSKSSGSFNGVAEAKEEEKYVSSFVEPRWVNGTWDLNGFQKDGKVDWDAVIDAEVRRRKWLQDYPESTSNDDLVVFDTSIIPWWVWVKRFHLPEAELLNGRAAMVGFFMAYFVDSLTGVGLVDQMGNFFCKTLLFVSVLGVLFVRKNEDVEKLKKLFDETTFYDKQWQAAWQEETPTATKKK